MHQLIMVKAGEQLDVPALVAGHVGGDGYS
jgi:hypothetical protein